MMNGINTTLCYLRRGGETLLLHRVKKEGDMNRDKWIGVGGKFLPGESPEDCLRREVMEETGLTLHGWAYRGIVTFVSDQYGTEYMHLFESWDFSGEVRDCDEGVLEWLPWAQLPKLPIWEGDKLFLRLLDSRRGFFSLKLRYEGERRAEAALGGVPLRKAGDGWLLGTGCWRWPAPAGWPLPSAGAGRRKRRRPLTPASPSPRRRACPTAVRPPCGSSPTCTCWPRR